jgi:aspartokinase
MKIANIVEEIVSKKPFIEEGLRKGIINVASLSEEIIPEIEKRTNETVKFSAVNMALRRLSEKIKEMPVEEIKFKNTDLTIRSDLIEIIIYKDRKSSEYLKKIYSKIEINQNNFLTITQGFNEIMIITNKKFEKEIVDIVGEKEIKKKIENVSSLSMKIPEELIKTPGFFFIITRSLAWENIPIVDIVSTFTEMTFILNEEDIGKSFDAIKKLINTYQ